MVSDAARLHWIIGGVLSPHFQALDALEVNCLHMVPIYCNPSDQQTHSTGNNHMSSMRREMSGFEQSFESRPQWRLVMLNLLWAMLPSIGAMLADLRV